MTLKPEPNPSEQPAQESPQQAAPPAPTTKRSAAKTRGSRTAAKKTSGKPASSRQPAAKATGSGSARSARSQTGRATQEKAKVSRASGTTSSTKSSRTTTPVNRAGRSGVNLTHSGTPITSDDATILTHSTVTRPDSRFLNRELSWLAFNERVLAEARDLRNPPLERLKYAAICGSNLDEFFMVRVASVHRQIAARVSTPSPDGLSPRETLTLVRERTHGMLQDIESAVRDVWTDLNRNGVKITAVADLSQKARAHLREHYLTEIQPVLTPLIVDPSHPFPYLSNLSLNLAVLLDGGKGENDEFARVKVPVGVLPRVVNLNGTLLLLEDVIAAHLGDLFKGRTVQSSHVFRVTRNTDYEFEEEEAEDLLATIEDGLRRRRFGAAVRMEIDHGMPREIVRFLQEKLHLAQEDIFTLQGPLGTSDLMFLPVDRPELAFEPFLPALTDTDDDDDSVFERLQRGDVVLHHPYDSFGNVLDFIEQAATDPNVLTIKQTLYRTGDDPRLLTALRTAAEEGKQVVALIELKARFDEQRNISVARKLERAGAHVVYGVPGLKTHAKVTLVVRREPGGLRRYVHIGTGNYNPKTARLYTDLSLLSADPELGADVAELFNHLTGYAEAEYGRLLVAPDSARSGFEALLEREIAHAAAGQEAWARIKVNSLTDPGMIEALYRASQAGVRVELVVRGVCCLRPGVPGLSENIAVHSLLGRYLEHARVYAFGNAGIPEVYFGSADWMSRNLDRRVEVVAPMLDDGHRDALLGLMDAEWQDERGTWSLDSNGSYRKCPGNRSAQGDFAAVRHPL